jgi:pyrroloquinoline quinone biosynthesis protein D
VTQGTPSAAEAADGISAEAKPALGRGFRLQWEPAQKAHVLLYPEGMVKLNGSAGEILTRCNGERTVAEIVSDLESSFSTTGLEKDVRAFMAFALEKQWLEIRG